MIISAWSALASMLGASTTPRKTSPAVPSDAVFRRTAALLLSRWKQNQAAVPWILAALFFTLYAALSVRTHLRMRTTGYDLGIFEQVVRAYAEGRAPVSELLGPGANALGDHFHPILVVLAPVYWLMPSALTLLVAQAALMALAVVPLTRWATREVGPGAALVVGFGFGASYGIQEAIGFDFHEICFAVPLLAFSLEALGNRRWQAAVAWALPLLLVKEDLGFTVAVLGGFLIAKGQRRLGAVTAACGVVGSLMEIFVVVPAFNSGGEYRFWSAIASDEGLQDLLINAPSNLVTPDVKATTLIMLTAPTAFVALRSPLIVLAVPTLAWRLLSDNPMYWDITLQYSAVLMPIVFAAFVDALGRWKRREGDRSIRAALVTSVAVTALLVPRLPLAELTESDTWSTDSRVVAAGRLLGLIPDGATVAVSNMLAPQLTNRCTVSLFPGYPTPEIRAEWIVEETGPPERWPYSAEEEARKLAEVRAAGYRAVAQEGDLILLRR